MENTEHIDEVHFRYVVGCLNLGYNIIFVCENAESTRALFREMAHFLRDKGIKFTSNIGKKHLYIGKATLLFCEHAKLAIDPSIVKRNNIQRLVTEPGVVMSSYLMRAAWPEQKNYANINT